MYIGNTPFQGLVGGGNILDASIEGVDLSTSAIAARLGYTPVDPGAAVFSANPTISSGTTYGIAYLNGSKVVTTGNAFTFNGTNVGIGTNGVATNAKLEVVASSGEVFRADGAGGAFRIVANQTDILLQGSTSIQGWINGSEQMRLTNAGLSVGISSGAGYLAIGSSAGRTQYQYINFGGAAGGTDYAWQIGRNPSTAGAGPADGFYIYDIKNSAARLAIDLSGRVTVGTLNPGSGGSAKFTVTGNSFVVNPNTDGKDTHVFTTGAVDEGTYAIKANTVTKVFLHSNGNSYLNGGNVGIGTTNPQSQLHVVTPSPNNSISFCVGASADGAIAYTTSEFRVCAFNVTSGSNFRISNGTTSASSWRAIFRGTWSNNYEGGGLTPPAPYIEVNSANNSFLVGSRTLAVDRDANGYLVVSCTDAYRISFTGTIEIYDNPQSGQPANSIVTIGKVGVGLRNPNYPLEAAGGVASRGVGFVLRNDAGSSNTGLFSPYNIIAGSGTDYSSTVFSETGLGIYFCVNGSATRSAILNSSGNFGLGTTDINYKITNSGHLAFTTGSIGTDSSGDAQRYGIGWQATGASTVLSSFITANNQGNWGSDIQFFTRGTSGGVLGERLRISAGGGGITAYTNLVFANNYTGIHWATANSGDLYMDCLPGERLVRLRNWNTGSPNIDVTAMQAGTFVPTIGVKFPASQNASSDPNTLDDYEEGTWTPALNLLGTVSYSMQKGWYVKVGKFVTIGFYITVSSSDTTQDATLLQISGNPFSAVNDYRVANSSCMVTENMRGAINPTAANTFHVMPVPNSSNLNVIQNNYNGNIAQRSYYTTQTRSGYNGGSMYMHGVITYESSN